MGKTVYAIEAFESNYGGLHGMKDMEVVALTGDKEAEMYAEEMSRGVMESYYEIENSITEQVIEEGYEENSDEFWERYEEVADEHIEYTISVLSIGEDEYEARCRELNEEFYNDNEGFLDKYEVATL